MLAGLDMKKCVEDLAERYRICKETDVAHPFPTSEMLEKILETAQLVRTQAVSAQPNQPEGHVNGYFPVKLGEAAVASSAEDASALEEWFPGAQYDEMRAWSQLAIELRI